jgi:hypothetical protein
VTDHTLSRERVKTTSQDKSSPRALSRAFTRFNARPSPVGLKRDTQRDTEIEGQLHSFQATSIEHDRTNAGHSVSNPSHVSSNQSLNPMRVDVVEPILKEACSQVYPESAICVQRFDDSLNSAIRITYRISLRSSSLREPRYPLLRVVLMFLY